MTRPDIEGIRRTLRQRGDLCDRGEDATDECVELSHDVPALLAYIDQLEQERDEARAEAARWKQERNVLFEKVNRVGEKWLHDTEQLKKARAECEKLREQLHGLARAACREGE
jgi:uncharacterized coiled-coil DUF342 family protein